MEITRENFSRLMVDGVHLIVSNKENQVFRMAESEEGSEQTENQDRIEEHIEKTLESEAKSDHLNEILFPYVKIRGIRHTSQGEKPWFCRIIPSQRPKRSEIGKLSSMGVTHAISILGRKDGARGKTFFLRLEK